MRNGWLGPNGLVLALLAAISAAGCAHTAPLCCFDVEGNVAERTVHVGCPDVHEVSAVAAESDALDVETAVALALANNPGFQELLADLEIAQADVIQAHQLPNPELTTMFPVGPKQWELTLMVPLDALVLRPHRTAAAQLESQRVAERLVQDGLNVVRDVRVAYADLAQQQRNLQLTTQVLDLRREIARVAKARLDAGEVSELDVASARLEDGLTEEQLIRDRAAVELAQARLQFVVGLDVAADDLQTIPLAHVPRVTDDVEQLVAEALGARPDLLAIEMAIMAASERAHLAYYDYFNLWGALPDINSKGDKGFEAGPGLRLALPLFHQNQGAKARTAAEVDRLQRQYSRQQAQVALEVRLAYTQLNQAQEQLALFRAKVLPQAETATAAARAALAEDGASLVLLLETSRQLLDARLREAQAEASVHRALAELERSVGHSLTCWQNSHGTEELDAPEPDTEVVEETTP